MDAEAIAAAKNLKVIARAGVGLDNVDIKAATQAGVMVVNAPTSNIVSAAELTVGHILSLARHIPQASSALKDGEWKRSKYTGIELFEKKIGIIGLGRIGALVAARLKGFDTKILAYDPYITSARAAQLGVQLVTLDELLAQSDFITIHMPKTPETVGMLGAEAFKKMKRTALRRQRRPRRPGGRGSPLHRAAGRSTSPAPASTSSPRNPAPTCRSSNSTTSW